MVNPQPNGAAQAPEASGPVGPPRVVTFGEAMVRLTPPDHERLERATSLDVTIGGAELNTAVGLVGLGVDAGWVSALPRSPLGRLISRQAAANGVDLSGVQWVDEDEGRAGLYFLEEAMDPRPSAVTYDRKDSAFALIRPGSFDWPRLLEGARLFHVSGITLALSPAVYSEALEAVRIANQMGVTVSLDLNYRAKLWSEADARKAFTEIVPRVDVMFASRGALRTFFNIEGSYEEVLRTAVSRLGIAAVTVTRKRAKGSRRLKITSHAMGQAGVLATSDTYDIEIRDRLGGGDAYAAGFIAAYLEDPHALTRAVSLGAAASALKHTMPGDFLCATRDEVEAAAKATGAGVLQR